MKKWDIKIVILSRGRSNNVKTTNILPDFIPIVAPESEKKLYEANYSNPIITIPDEEKGLGNVRNWCIKNLQENTIIMLDDDITACCCLSHERTVNIKDPEEVLQILINTAVMAQDLGVKVFGFNQTDIRKYNGCEPFNLNTWVGGVIGVIGKNRYFRKDYFKVDIDYCLKSLMVERIMFQNTMYLFRQSRDTNKGGNAMFRTEKDYNKSVETLKEKWGDALRVRKHKSQIKITLNCPRRQKIEYD